MGAIMDGEATPAQIGALLAALRMQGRDAWTRSRASRARCGARRACPLASRGAVDTCGTGGDGAGTFNISTAAAFVVAACGAPVAKHGNRAASRHAAAAPTCSRRSGVRIDAPTATVQRRSTRWAGRSCSRPRFHAAMRHAVGPRRELGVRTVFNLLGPLTNPARPEAQLRGRARRRSSRPSLARCLRGSGRARLVVHGSGPRRAHARRAHDRRRSWTARRSAASRSARRTPASRPSPLEALRGGDPQANAAIARDVLAGRPGAAARRRAAERRRGARGRRQAESLRDGVRLAAAAIDDGRARALAGSRAGGAAHERACARAACSTRSSRARAQSVAREKQRRPLDGPHPDVGAARRPRAPFAAALARPGAIAVIAEIKRRSPSRGAIRERPRRRPTSRGATRPAAPRRSRC